MRKPLVEAQVKPEEEEPCSSTSSVTAPRVSPESPPSLKPVVSSVLDRVLTCVWGTSLWFPFLTCSWQFFFSHKVCEIQLKSTNSCGSLEELAQAGDGLFPQDWRELSAKALWAPRMCCGKFFNYCFHLFSSFRTSLFLFLFVIWLYFKKTHQFLLN